MILAEGLVKQFDEFRAVDGVNLTVEPGQVLVLLGPNGAGKTTTIRMLTSVLVPTRGRATVAGFDVVREAQNVRASVGVLTEHHGLYGRMNAAEYLEFFGRLYGLEKNTIRRRAVELQSQFGLDVDSKRRLGEYSKGMRQKLALVRTLLHDPPVLLLDEPTSAMDPESARTVREAIGGLRSDQRTILLCTHNLIEAESLADLVAVMHRGRIITSETVGRMKDSLPGAALFEARLAAPLDGWRPVLPEGVSIHESGRDWIRFQVQEPAKNNPRLLRQMLEDRLQVVSFTDTTRSLEKAYLEAVNQAANGEI